MKGIVLGMLLFVSNILVAQTLEQLVQNVDKKIQKSLRKEKFAGLSIALFDRDSILWTRGYGIADKVNQIAVTPSTVFPIGSISKVITAAAIMKLVQSGKIDLDEPYTTYVPEFSMKRHFQAEPFTVRDLMTHYSGVPRVRVKGLYSDNPAPIINLIEDGKEDYLIAPPKTLYQYSDWGVTLLGCLIEKVTGEDFREHIAHEVFEPLKMDGSSLFPHRDIPNFTKGFDDDLNETKVFMNQTLPADGVKSTVTDMAQFIQTFLNDGMNNEQRFLEEKIAREMTTVQDENYPLGIGVRGLGWFVDDYHGNRMIYHYGDMYPCISGAVFLPDLGVGVVLFSNTYKGIKASTRILDTTLDELIQLKDAKKNKTVKTKLAKKKINEGGEKYLGRYATPIGVIEILPKSNKKVKVKFWQEGQSLSGVYQEDGSLSLRKLGFEILTLSLKNIREEEFLLYKENGRFRPGGKRVIQPELSPRWRKVVGSYSVKDFAGGYEFLSSFEIKEKDGLLIGEGATIYPTIPEFQIVLLPINDDQAIIQGVGGEGLLGETVPISIEGQNVELRLIGYDLIKQKN